MTDETKPADRVAAFCNWLETIPASPPFHMHPAFAQFADLSDAEMQAAGAEMLRRSNRASAEADELQKLHDRKFGAVDPGAADALLERLHTDPAEWADFLIRNAAVVCGDRGVALDVFAHAIDAGRQQERFKVMGCLDELAAKAATSEQTFLLDRAITEITTEAHYQPTASAEVVPIRPKPALRLVEPEAPQDPEAA